MKRRQFLSLTYAWAMASLAGLSAFSGQADATATQAKVYKDPSCGCCNVWIKHLTDKGFSVEAFDTLDMTKVKSDLGIPDNLQSCHTALIDEYVVEGHVPVADIERLLVERPVALGLAVPGMPVGSPGMEYGDEREPYNVILFGSDGQRSVFARY